MYKKILASPKIPTTPPSLHNFSNGPSLNDNLGQNELVICNQSPMRDIYNTGV